MSTNNIAKIRVENGYTQEKVAKSLGVSRPTYINIESGKKELTLSQAEILSTIFRVRKRVSLSLRTFLTPTKNTNR